MIMKTQITTVEEYLATQSVENQVRIQELRQVINDNAPDAIEGIFYGMIGYKLNKKPLVYVGGFTKHIGFYATPTGHEKFKEELSSYKQGKGSVQFPLDKPLPVDLIVEMVKFRVIENNQK